MATPLAVVLNELLQNAVDHAYPQEVDLRERPGRVQVTIEREDKSLTLRVTDDGVGLPEGFSPEAAGGLGLSIVRTLVTSDLDGEFSIVSGDGEGDRRGAEVWLRIPVEPGDEDGLVGAP
jgi:two-component sensor histidine kinase